MLNTQDYDLSLVLMRVSVCSIVFIYLFMPSLNPVIGKCIFFARRKHQYTISFEQKRKKTSYAPKGELQWDFFGGISKRVKKTQENGV